MKRRNSSRSNMKISLNDHRGKGADEWTLEVQAGQILIDGQPIPIKTIDQLDREEMEHYHQLKRKNRSEQDCLISASLFFSSPYSETLYSPIATLFDEMILNLYNRDPGSEFEIKLWFDFQLNSNRIWSDTRELVLPSQELEIIDWDARAEASFLLE